MTNDLLRSGYTFTDQNTSVTNQFLYNPADVDMITDPDFSSAYWWGWVSWDDLPSSAHLSRHSIDDDGNVIFEDVTRQENVDLTYTTYYSNNLPSDYYRYNYYYRYDDDLGRWKNWRTNTAVISAVGQYSRLYNRSDVNIYAYYQARLQFSASVDGTSRVLINAYCPIPTLYENFSISGVFSSGGYSDITITPDDLTGDVVTRAHDGHSVKMCLQSVGLDLYARPITTAGALSRYMIPHPAYRIHDTDDNAYILAMTYDGTGQPELGTAWQGGGIRLASSGAINSAPIDLDTGVIAGGFVGKITPEQIAAAGAGQDLIAIHGANFALAGLGRPDLIRVVRMYDLTEVRKIFGFQMRVTVAENLNRYENTNDQYYPLVVGSQFMGTLIRGETDRDRLQDWQIVGNTVDPDTNGYTESDKPIYIPPDPDDRDKIGDNIGFRFSFPASAATGLYTMYALRAAHMGQLGAKLWSSIGDSATNFWQNLQMAIGAYGETGSADISQILEYFTSLRVYPFALASLPGFSGAGTGSIRVGTGKTALDLSGGGAGNVGVMGDFTGIIDAGAVVVPYHYDDFRDIDGVTVSVYLPYIGTQTLNAADVLGCTLSLTYAVDLTTGSCVAYLLCSGGGMYYPIGIYSGTIGADIPLTATQGNRLFTRQLSSAIGDISSLVSGKLIPDSVGAGMTAISKMQSAANALTSGGLTPPSLGGGGANFAGFGAPQTAYLQIRRHKYAYTGRTFPASQLGRRTSGVQYLGALSGYTVCENVDVSGIPAPADVQRDIKNMLESGVYL